MNLQAPKFWLFILVAGSLGILAARMRLLESGAPSTSQAEANEWVIETDTQTHSWNSLPAQGQEIRKPQDDHTSSVLRRPTEASGPITTDAETSGSTTVTTGHFAKPNESGFSPAAHVPNSHNPSLGSGRAQSIHNTFAATSIPADGWEDANATRFAGQMDDGNTTATAPIEQIQYLNLTPSTAPEQPLNQTAASDGQDIRRVATYQDSQGIIQAQPIPGQHSEGAVPLSVPALESQLNAILSTGTAPVTTDRLPASAPNSPPIQPRPTSRVQGNGDKITLRLNNEDLRLVLEMVSLETGLSILPSENVKGTVTANITDVSVMDALEAVLTNAGFQMQKRGSFLFVGTPGDFERMELVSLAPETRVVRPCFVTAKELKPLLEPLLSSTGSINITSAAAMGLGQSSSGSSSGAILGSTASSAGSGASAASGDYSGNDIIVIRDVPTAIMRIEELIQQIDVPPLQVAIEALILSVKLDDKHRLGVNLELLKGDGVRVVSGNLPGSLDTLETGQGLLSMGFLEANVGSFIAALDDIGETNVIAAPHVLALNKMPAQILIGEQIGFANTTVTQTAATQSIQFLDVGTQLQIRPHVNEEGLIRLEIHPEVSQGTVRSVGDLALPEKTVTQVTTNVMCRDAETIIIGGLIREEIDDVHRGVPLLGKMSWVGPLFRSRNRNTSREELLVLLTPHVIRDPADALPDPGIVENFIDRRASILIRERRNGLLRRQEAQRYVSLARSAWVSGNPSACQRYCQIAIELDPSCAQSLEFAGDWSSMGAQADEQSMGEFFDGSSTIPTYREAAPVPLTNPQDPETLRLDAPTGQAPDALEPQTYLIAPPNSETHSSSTSNNLDPISEYFSLGSQPRPTANRSVTNNTVRSAANQQSTGTSQNAGSVGLPFGANRR